MTVGERIKLLREQNNLTQTDVAKQIGIATQSIFKYEKNIVTNIPLDNIEKMAKVFGVSPSYIMGWEDSTTLIESTDIEKKTAQSELPLSPEQQDLISSVTDLSQDEVKKTLEYVEFLKSKQNP